MRNEDLLSEETYNHWKYVNKESEEELLWLELKEYYNQSKYGSRWDNTEGFKQQNKAAFELLLEETNYPLEKFMERYERHYKRETYPSTSKQGCGEDYINNY